MESLYSSLKLNFEQYSFDGLEDYFDKLDESELKNLLIDIKKNTNLINQFPNKEILNFRNLLEEYFLKRGIETNFFYNIETIENLYRNILNEKKELDFDESKLFKNLFKLAKEKYEYIIEYLKKDLNEGDILNEKQLETDSVNNEIDVFCKLLNYNLQNICHLKPKLVNKKNELVLPHNILENEEYDIDLLKGVLSNTGIWDIAQDIDYNFKFFNEDSHENIINEKNEICVKASLFHLYAVISLQRMGMIHTDILLSQYRIFGETLKFMDDTVRDLLFLRSLFYRLYFIDIEIDKSDYKGLTIKEWLLGFLSLKEISGIHKFNSVSFDEIRGFFAKNGIHDDKHLIIINNLTYKKEKRADLYDTPIIKLNDDSYLIFPLSIKFSNLEKILCSIFSKLKLSLVDKGKLFEKEVLKELKKIEKKEFFFKVSEVEFSVKGEERPQYQYDAVIEWDDYVFIIECKNRSIATTEAISLNQFEQKIDDYIAQVNRFESGLIKNKDKHNIDLKNKTIIKVVLNSLPFALDVSDNNVYFIDYSLFLRFFSSKQICLETISNQSVLKQPVYELWTGDKPTVQDFINYLNEPPQILYFKEKLRLYKTLHNLGEYKLKVERYVWEI